MHKHRASVRIVLFSVIDPGQFVILSETDDPDNLKLPGGKVEQDEAPDAAAVRELREELGVTSQQVDLIPAGELPNENGISHRYIYAGKVDPAILRPSDEVHHTELVAFDTIPAGKNSGHIRSAALLAQTTLSK